MIQLIKDDVTIEFFKADKEKKNIFIRHLEQNLTLL